METKICTKCKKELGIAEFYKDGSRKDGLCNKCKICSNENHRKWLSGHKDVHAGYVARWQSENKEQFEEQKRRWRREHPGYHWEYKKKRFEHDEAFHMIECLRSRLKMAFKQQGLHKTQRASKYGVDFNAIVKFMGPKPGPEYSIDHIRPLSSFDMSNPEDVKLAFRPENHQWLPLTENISKGATY